MTSTPALRIAAARFFFDPTPFLTAFARDPHAAILALRDDRQAFGHIRSYVGEIATAAAHAKVLAAGRAAWTTIDATALARSTRRTRQAAKP